MQRFFYIKKKAKDDSFAFLIPEIRILIYENLFG